MTAKPRILIVGGYGAFGTRAAERLAREPDLDVIVAGRSLVRAQETAAMLAQTAKTTVTAMAFDAVAPDMAALAGLAPAVIINASGPFQTQQFALAHAAIRVGAHYIDLADAADFVLDFARDKGLDVLARERGVLVTSGASTVPAISGAVLDHFAKRFATLQTMRHGVTPGNSFDPGPATTASILSAIGKPFQMLREGNQVTVHGWQGLSRHRFPQFGNRWMGYCNVPDLKLFPQRYPDLRTVDFRAGVEVPLFHLGIWVLSWPSRWGILPRPEILVKPLLVAKRLFSFLGTDEGGMFVVLDGVDGTGARKQIGWHLVASKGHGPYIPTTPAVILARKLARGEIAVSGACACVGLVTLAEIEWELADLAITTVVS
jgi:saccharopine dehydrogenase-like NADP-dependent oxidoreductase